jgi:DNA modification methylase
MNTINTFLNRIICGDCIEVMREMPSASVDFVVTDPPYLVNYRSRDGRRYPNDDNDRWLRPAFAEVARVLKHDRFCVSFYGWNKADRFLAAWKAAGLQPVGHLVWAKDYHSNILAGFFSCLAIQIHAGGRARQPPPPLRPQSRDTSPPPCSRPQGERQFDKCSQSLML